MEAHRYRLFGLTVESAIPLPDLPPAPDAMPADVVIDYGAVPRPDGVELAGLRVIPEGAVLNIPEAGRYLITGGDRIAVEPGLTATERSVRLYLLGSAFGAILHQRRLLPLHANVIDFGGAAVAFMGHSGAGKSTLANWFHDRGRPILSDDVCVVRVDAAGTAVVEPGMPRIRLWADALAASGRNAGDYQASFDDMDKYDVPIAAPAASAPLPLAAVYLLRAADTVQPGGIARLTGADAIQALVANTYRGGYVPLMDGVAHHLAQSVALARRVPVFAVRRRWGRDVFDEEAARVEHHVGTVLQP